MLACTKRWKKSRQHHCDGPSCTSTNELNDSISHGRKEAPANLIDHNFFGKSIP